MIDIGLFTCKLPLDSVVHDNGLLGGAEDSPGWKTMKLFALNTFWLTVLPSVEASGSSVGGRNGRPGVNLCPRNWSS